MCSSWSGWGVGFDGVHKCRRGRRAFFYNISAGRATKTTATTTTGKWSQVFEDNSTAHPVVILQNENNFAKWLQVSLFGQNACLAQSVRAALAVRATSDLERRPPQPLHVRCFVGSFPCLTRCGFSSSCGPFGAGSLLLGFIRVACNRKSLERCCNRRAA